MKCVAFVTVKVISRLNWLFNVVYVELVVISTNECKKTDFVALRLNGATEGYTKVGNENDIICVW